MSEHISNGDYLTLLVRSWVFAQTIAMEHQLPDAVQAADRASQLGPYIDPTSHIANGGKLDQDLTVLRILNRARDELIAAFPAIATTPVTIGGHEDRSVSNLLDELVPSKTDRARLDEAIAKAWTPPLKPGERSLNGDPWGGAEIRKEGQKPSESGQE